MERETLKECPACDSTGLNWDNGRYFGKCQVCLGNKCVTKDVFEDYSNLQQKDSGVRRKTLLIVDPITMKPRRCG